MSTGDTDKKAIVEVSGNSVFKIDLPKETVENVVQFVCSLLGNVIDEPSKVLGQVISDQFKAFRITNLHRLSQKIHDNGIKLESLPIDFAIPLIESAANVSDATLQHMWANLLASAVHNPENARVSYVRVLEQLDPSDAKLLHVLAESRLHLVRKNGQYSWHDGECEQAKKSELSDESLTVSVTRLNALDLCVMSIDSPDNQRRFGRSSNRRTSITRRMLAGPPLTCVQLTTLGGKALESFGVEVTTTLVDRWVLQHSQNQKIQDSSLDQNDVQKMIKKNVGMV